METTVAVGRGCTRLVCPLIGVVLLCALELAGCAKGAKEQAQRTDPFRAGGAGQQGSVSTCGNGMRDLNEQCEGADLGDASCMSLGFAGGLLNCTAECTYDRSMCSDSPGGVAGMGG